MSDERDQPKEPENAPDDGKPDEEELKELPEADNADFQRMNDHVREIRRTYLSTADRQNLAYGGGDAVGGHKVGHDLNIFMAGGEKEPWPIVSITRNWADIRQRLAGTPSKERLIRLLRSEPVVVLQGRSGTGRKTAALAALAHRHPELHEISPERSLAHLDKEKLHHGHGYLYDASSRLSGTGRLTELEAFACRDALVARNAQLVILVGPDTDTSEVGGIVVRHEPPDAMDVLERHLSARLTAVGVDVRSIADEVTERPETPRDAMELARDLAEGIQAGRPIKEICRNRVKPLRRQAREVLRQQDTDKDLARRAFVIAGAALNGLPTVEVCRAAYDLATRLHKLEREGKRSKLALPPFGAMLGDWLEHAREERPEFIEEMDRTLSFRHGFATSVLDAVWLDYVVAHKALLDWLSELARTGSPKTRLKVAHTLAQFAVYDFTFIYDNCILEWSRSRYMSLHVTTAWTLEAIAFKCPSRRPDVIRSVRPWATTKDLRRAATTVRLLGTRFGTVATEDAMRILEKIAVTHRGRLNGAIRNTVVELFLDGSPGIVVAKLTGWARLDHPVLSELAARSLADLAWLGPADRPPLLTYYNEDPTQAADLWREVLSSRYFDQKPWNALRTWAKNGLDIGALLRDLHAEPGLRPRLRFYQVTPPFRSEQEATG